MPFVTATRAIGRVLYTQYFYLFQVAGLVLLVAMIGAIVLTLRHKETVKRQSIAEQVAGGLAVTVAASERAVRVGHLDASGQPAAPPSDDFIMRNAMDSQEVAVDASDLRIRGATETRGVLR